MEGGLVPAEIGRHLRPHRSNRHKRRRVEQLNPPERIVGDPSLCHLCPAAGNHRDEMRIFRQLEIESGEKQMCRHRVNLNAMVKAERPLPIDSWLAAKAIRLNPRGSPHESIQIHIGNPRPYYLRLAIDGDYDEKATRDTTKHIARRRLRSALLSICSRRGSTCPKYAVTFSGLIDNGRHQL
jgi:hypothetical protein